MFYLYDFNERKESCKTVINHFRSVNYENHVTYAKDGMRNRIKELLNRILNEKMTNGDHELLQFCLKNQKDSQGFYKTMLANL